MNIRKYIFTCALAIVTLYACNNDDDDNGGVNPPPPRDRAAQQVEEAVIIQNYLDTHFFTLVDNPLNPNHKIALFDTIAGANSTLVTYRGELFYDNIDRDADGIPDTADIDSKPDGSAFGEDETPTTRPDADGDGIADDSDADNPDLADQPDSDGDGIIDSKDPVDNNDLNRRLFDNSITPVWFDQTRVVQGWREGLVELKGSSGFTENPDGTVDFNNDFGDLVVFMPSGLAYFNIPPFGTRIPLYAPLIFNIQLYQVNEADHDRDGIPSYLEDLDDDRIVLDIDDNTDGDPSLNYQDNDDDNDGTLTRDEITANDLNNDGFIDPNPEAMELIFYDDDGDDIPNHLDQDDRAVKN